MNIAHPTVKLTKANVEAFLAETLRTPAETLGGVDFIDVLDSLETALLERSRRLKAHYLYGTYELEGIGPSQVRLTILDEEKISERACIWAGKF